MALGILGDLEERNSTPDRRPALHLFNQAIQAAQCVYDDHHVYPYTYLGGYFYRKKMYKEALQKWAAAAGVIKKWVPFEIISFFNLIRQIWKYIY